MAVKPVISSMTPWDAEKEYLMKFSYTGDLPVSNRLTIYDADSGAQVYDRIEVTPHFYHTIDPDTSGIRNGFRYKAHLIVTDNNHIESTVSDDVFFLCLSTPYFAFEIPVSENVTKSYIDIMIGYSQREREELYSYSHKLYNYSKQIVASSDIRYNRSDSPYLNLTYTFRGLSDKTHYYIRSEGVTKNGIPVQTDLKHIFVDYGGKELTSVLSLYSDENATVTGKMNIIAIDADEDPNDYMYIGSQVVLLDQDIHYNHNFEIVGDFTCSLKARMTHGNLRLLKMNRKNGSGFIELTSNLVEDKVVYRLRVHNGMSDYNLFSDLMNVSNEDTVIIHIRRKNNIYQLTVYKL